MPTKRSRISHALRSAFFLCIVFTAQIAAQEGGSQPAQAVEPATPYQLHQELEVARAQLASADRFRADVLRTVYWSLGTVGTLAFALLAFSWFLNMRVGEREREALQKSLSALVRDELTEAKKALAQDAETLKETVVKEVSRATAGLKRVLDIHEYELRCLELANVKSSGVSATAITANLKVAKAAHRIGWELQTADALHEIERLLAEGERFDASEMPEVESFLGVLPEIHQSLRDRIRKRLLE